MAKPNLNDLRLALRDLFHKRAASLQGSRTWITYEPLLRKYLADLEALPKTALGPKAMAAELNATDKIHDGFGGAVYFLLEAYLRVPTASAEVKAAAKRIRDVFVPQLDDLQGSHADEASAASERRGLLSSMEPDLKLFPVIAGEGSEKKHPTLYDWVKGQLDAGDRLSQLLSERADSKPGSRAQAPTLRVNIIGMIGRLRAGLSDELKANPKLPTDLDATVFAYYDLLASLRDAGSTDEAPPPADDTDPEEKPEARPAVPKPT